MWKTEEIPWIYENILTKRPELVRRFQNKTENIWTEQTEKLSLVAVDDGIFPEIVHPPMTVGVQPLREIAEGACELLKKKWKMKNREAMQR